MAIFSSLTTNLIYLVREIELQPNDEKTPIRGWMDTPLSKNVPRKKTWAPSQFSYILTLRIYLLILDHCKKKKNKCRQGAIRIRFIVLSVENTCSVKASVQQHESLKFVTHHSFNWANYKTMQDWLLDLKLIEKDWLTFPETINTTF